MSGRKIIERFGKKGRENYVRVFAEKVGRHTLVRVQWREQGKPRTESWPNNRKGIDAAKAYAEGTHERLTRKPPAEIAPVTLGQLWAKYVTAQQDAVSERTIDNATKRWRKFEAFAGHGTMATDVTRDRMNEFKAALLKMGHAPNQVGLIIGVVRAVYRWGEDDNVIPATKIPTYRTKLSKDVRAKGPKMAEYRSEERERIAAHFDPRDARRWRPYVLTTLFAYLAPRQYAARHLEWRDVDFAHTRLHWRAENDKMRRDRYQPIPGPVVEALWVAYGWRLAMGYTGRWVFPGAQRATRGETRELKAWEMDPKHKRAGKTPRAVGDRPWSYQAYNDALHAAEDATGIGRKKYRGAHGFRRGVANDVRRLTGSDTDAANYIGNESVRVTREHYFLEREDEMRMIGGQLAASTEAPPKGRDGTEQNAIAAHDGAATGELTHE